MAIRVLVVDDQFRHRDSVKLQLDRAGYRTTARASGEEALAALEIDEFDVALIDYKMANMDGMELLKRIRARWPRVAVILMTGYASIPTAVEAIKTGAADFLEKPFKPEVLLEKLKKVMAESSHGGSNGKNSPFDEIVGRTAAIQQAVELGRSAAEVDKPILILGELGTGREAMARAIHSSGPRREGPFVTVRCSGAHAQIENELFGTAGGGHAGKIVEANGGTLYLEEVLDLGPDIQARLMRFLQDSEIPRGNGMPASRSDARVVASTARDPDAEVAADRLRRDLHLRLKGMLIRLPALRDRLGDLPLLVQQLCRRAKGRAGGAVRFSKEALSALASLDFPGNLRELENLVGQAIALSRDGEVTLDTLSSLGITSAERVAGDSTIKDRVEFEERRVIQEELRRNPHNLKQVARNLNISRTTLWRKMKRYGLEAT
jgi:two-component system response regulator HydG